MPTIFRYYIRQIRNYWKNLGLRIKTELLFLFIILSAFLSQKGNIIFDDLLARPGISDIGLASIIAHSLVLLTTATLPFIYLKLLPHQKGITILRQLPLRSTGAFTLVVTYIIKYQLPIIIIFIPLFISLGINLSPVLILYLFLVLILFTIIFLMLLLVLVQHTRTKNLVILVYYSVIAVYFGFYAVIYYYDGPYILTDFLIACLLGVIGYVNLRLYHQEWDIYIFKFDSSVRKIRTRYKINYHNLPSLWFTSLHPLLAKEFLGRIRNKNFMRMKIINLSILIAVLLFSQGYFPESYPQVAALISFIFIWIHYTHQFNEKYVFKEPRQILNMLPLSYRQIWLAHFLLETGFLIPVLLIFLSALLLYGSAAQQILLLMLALLLFSFFILYTITNVRMIFYDDPRLAGYAYHFLIIFSAIMISSFYLAGPLVVIFLLLYTHYLSFRNFAR